MSWMDSASGSSTFHGGGGYSGNNGPSGAGTGGMGGGSNNSGSRTGGLGGGVTTGTQTRTTYVAPVRAPAPVQTTKVTAASQARMKHQMPENDPIAAARANKHGTSTPVQQNRVAIGGMKGGYGVQAYNGGPTAPTKSITDRVPQTPSFTGNNFNPNTGKTTVSVKFQDRVTPGAR